MFMWEMKDILNEKSKFLPLDQKQQIKPKEYRRKKPINIYAEINEIDSRNTKKEKNLSLWEKKKL